MKIKWNGHACFTLTNAAGHTLMTDPFDPGCGYPNPSGSVDVVTMSHHHRDHDYIEALTGYGTAFDTQVDAVSEYGFEISSVQAYHDGEKGAKRGKNLIFKIKADGQTVIHMGDMGHYPDEKQLEFIKDADLMLIPIGGFFTIDTKTAVSILKAAAPKAAIAMHFKAAQNPYPIADAAEFISLTNAVYKGHEEEISGLKGCCVFRYE